MSNEFYEQYHQKGGTYVIPVEVFNELLEENKRLREWDNNKDTRNSRQRVANKKLIKENEELKRELNELQKPQIFIDTQDIEERYGEGKYQDYLEKEVKELKKQLEECEIQNTNLREGIMIKKMAFPNNKIKDKTFYNLYDMPSYEDLLKQQQAFIKYLEDEIKACEAVSDLLFNHNKELKVYKEILQKYEEIIGVKDEKNDD